jgi:aminoglycoside 6'-N-acetyltransferase
MTASAHPVKASQAGPSAYQFRAMSARDLKMVGVWLTLPHVREWWGNPDEQLGLVSADLAEPAMEQFIVTCRGQPFAYLQCYQQSAWPENGLGVHPLGTRGIDQFIGEPDMVGRGHGSAFIRAFVDGLLAIGVPRVLTDPAPVNARAIRAYTKAGFREHAHVDTPDGGALLMIRDNPTAG